MTANVEALVREGISAFKAGRRDEARTFLMKAVELDQYNEQAWLWLSAAVDSVEDQRTCLENVLAINPDNARARNGLQLLAQQTPEFPFTEPAAPPPEELPTSVEWDTPALDSDEPAQPSAEPDAGTDTYDAWVAGLNLAPSSTTTTSDDELSSPAFEEDFFSDRDDVFGSSGSSIDSQVFVSIEDDDVFGPDEVPPPPEPLPGLTPAPQTAPPPARDEAAEPDLSDIPTTGVFATVTDDDDLFDAELEDLDAEELFRYIPPEIQPTRLPGTVERYPAVLLLGFIILLVLNVGAAALLIYRLL